MTTQTQNPTETQPTPTAALSAAAPELLAALEKCVALLNTACHPCRMAHGSGWEANQYGIAWDHAVQDATAALAKARGESHPSH